MKELKHAQNRSVARDMVFEGTGLTVDITHRCGSVRHLLTHRDMNITVFAGQAHGSTPALQLTYYTSSIWIRGDDALDNLGVGRVTRKLLEVANTSCENAQE